MSRFVVRGGWVTPVMPPFTHSTGSSSLHVSHFQSEPLLTEQDSSERRWHHESEDICSSPKSSSYGSVFLRWHRRLVLWLRITGRDNEQKGDLEHGEASSCRRQLVGKALCLCRRSRRVRYILLVILSIFIMLFVIPPFPVRAVCTGLSIHANAVV